MGANALLIWEHPTDLIEDFLALKPFNRVAFLKAANDAAEIVGIGQNDIAFTGNDGTDLRRVVAFGLTCEVVYNAFCPTESSANATPST